MLYKRTNILEHGYYENVGGNTVTCFYSNSDETYFQYRTGATYPITTDCLSINYSGGIATITVNTDGKLKLEAFTSSSTISEIHNGSVTSGTQFELYFSTYVSFTWCFS